MGQLYNIERARRFTSAFQDLVGGLIRPSTYYKVESSALGIDDNGVISVYAMMRESGGIDKHEMILDGSSIDLDTIDQEDLIETLCRIFDITEEEARGRLRESGIMTEEGLPTSS